ncbi:nitroreductase family deazaflavin-dependent oxidoreductase [Streptomyces sp. ASQP_92]|uniref:nitroreductase family deazaflavin-dependent oxidoreductase n=1 Tax=Streptomyces sp. ASQP_92 TaxID=2979116 RepID=UPI0021C14CCE|nr:nitroreductase family deazaflavin-dependent oxidoreductase [Streptomyces sp. ASQP_92]MCT9091615.1 nitroreductase family deazaflavin-dependent oxidoreductase [Streptomyces sp. ASQP_92]
MNGRLGMSLVHKVMALESPNRVLPPLMPSIDRSFHRITRGRSLFFTLPDPKSGLILTTTGAQSGQPRRTPLLCITEEPDRWLVIGSNFGKPSHPGWTANLRQQPHAMINWRGRDIPVLATHLSQHERDARWPAIVAFWPPYEACRRRTDREIRVFRLTRRQITGQ